MKSTFMMTAAATALLTGMGVASAQMEQRKPAAAPDMSSSGSIDLKAKQDAQTKGNAQIKADQNLKAKADQNLKAQAPKAGAEAETTGQAGAKTEINKDADKARAQQKSGAEAEGSAKTGAAQSSGKTGDSARGKAETETSGAAASGATSGAAKVDLSTEQKTRIRQVVLKQNNAPRVSNVNFSLAVGTVIPRTVRYAPVPPTLIEIHPAWRGFVYFIVDEQIVIVEPDTLRIVTIIAV